MTGNPRLDELFEIALHQDPAHRTAFLERECHNDPALLEQLRSLLESDGEAAANNFWNSSALETEAQRSARQPDSRLGQLIGPYKLLEMIGSGGMGTVYRAVRDDAEYQKHVAIKLIKRGMDTDLIVRRFRNERQILAQLEHPNIARLLDGGSTEDGLPYLVMEYDHGEPIDAYADHHMLSTDQRLELFRTVCSAVEYAHQNLVIHRDLKPSNILVTADGAAKLLDFGIAKVLGAAGNHETMTALSFMTPEYASPEQVRGEALTTVSDVYSLGVLLFRLLTGRRPYRLKSRRPEDIANAICLQDAEKPSTAISRFDPIQDSTPETVSATREGDPARLRRRLRGDLDTIVLKAIRKEPERRYASAGQLSEDIRRDLEGQPVLAHRDTLRYRAGKFVRRNRLGVAAAAIILLCLLGGIAGTTWQAHVARAQRTRAEREFNDVRKLANSFLFEFHDSIKDIPGTLAARQLILKRALEYLDRLSHEAEDDRQLNKELAEAYDRVGTLTWDAAARLPIHRQALAIREYLVKKEPRNRTYREQLSDSYSLIGDCLKDQGDSAGALENYRKATRLTEALVAEQPGNGEYEAALANDYELMGIVTRRIGETDKSLEYVRAALALQERVVRDQPESIEHRQVLLNSHFIIASALEDNGDLKKAMDETLLAKGMAEALNARNPMNVMLRRNLWVGELRRARLLAKLGDNAGAVAGCRRGLGYIETLSNADPGDKGHRRALAVTYLQLADALLETKAIGPALLNYEKAIATSEALLKADPNKPETSVDLATMYTHLGGCYLRSGAILRAQDYLRRGRELFERTSAADPLNSGIQYGKAECYTKLADLEAAQNHAASARDFYQLSRSVLRELQQRNTRLQTSVN